MIQRIQSIYLFLAIIFTSLLWLEPFDFSKNEIVEGLTPALADGEYNIYDNIFFQVLAGLGILTCFFAIFLYRNRKLQIKITQASLIINMLLLIISIGMFYQGIVSFNDTVKWSPSLGWFVPILSGVCIILAMKLIQKDEKLVKSMDRLR